MSALSLTIKNFVIAEIPVVADNVRDCVPEGLREAIESNARLLRVNTHGRLQTSSSLCSMAKRSRAWLPCRLSLRLMCVR